MKSISLNPFRVLGIKANASAPEKQRARNKIAAYIKVGKAPILDFDLCPPLEELIRSQELIDLKSNEILSDSDKLKNALFWFVSGGTIDEIALSSLTESKDLEKALSIFENGSKGFVITNQSITSIINHSSFEIITYPSHRDKQRLKKAIENKLAIASSDKHLSFLLQLLNPNNPLVSSAEIKSSVIEITKTLLKDIFPGQKEEDLYLEFFSGQKDIIEKINEKNNKKLIRTIKEHIRDCENKREQILDDETGKSLLIKSAKIGDDLLTKTENLLKKVARAYGSNSMIVSNIYEEVINEANYCAVGASNKFQEAFGRMVEYDRLAGIRYIKTNGKYCYDDILKLTERAYNIIQPINTPARDQITRNLEVLKSTRNDWRNFHNQVAEKSSPTGSSVRNSGGSSDDVNWLAIIIGGIILLGILSNC